MLQVTCAIIIKNNKILITRNNANSDHPFMWEFPGGKVLPDETEEQCIIREIREELELDISVLAALQPVTHDYNIKQIRLIPFVCSIKSGEIKLNHHLEKAWISTNELASIAFSEADKKLIRIEDNSEALKKYTGEQID